MARTRAQRRRHTLLITLALAITLVVLVFARDVSRSAHDAVGPRRSENLSFGALANALLKNENNFDSRLERLLSQGTNLSRPVFAARLNQLDEVLPSWTEAAVQLRHPVLAHHVSESLDSLTETRVAAYQTLLREVAHALNFPWHGGPAIVISNPVATLETTSQVWNVDRYALVKEPGRVHLVATTTLTPTFFAVNGVSTLTQSPSLALHRGIGIAAVKITPDPLPAVRGVILLPPVSSVLIGISVLNVSYDEQPVTVNIRVTPLNNRGVASSQTMTATLGPLQAYAFVAKSLQTQASERAHVVITITGAPGASGMNTSATYLLKMSPSGNA